MLWKNGTLMVTLTNYAIPGPDLHWARPLVRRGFLQHLSAVRGDIKKVLRSERRAMALCHMVNSALVTALRS